LKEPADSSIAVALNSQASEMVSYMNRGIEVSSLGLQIALAHAGAGLAVVSALGASHAYAKGLQFVFLDPVVERKVYLLTRRDRTLNPAARAFIQAIKAGLADAALHPKVVLGQVQ
jgi:LysR family carnitine catabolism transcriptional activator